jgi:uncharacterized membrane protein
MLEFANTLAFMGGVLVGAGVALMFVVAAILVLLYYAKD